MKLRPLNLSSITGFILIISFIGGLLGCDFFAGITAPEATGTPQPIATNTPQPIATNTPQPVESDESPPEILCILPADDENDVLTDTDITVVFNESLDNYQTGAVHIDSIEYIDGINCEISFSMTDTENDTVIVNPSIDLSGGTTYEGITISGFRDSSHNTMEVYRDLAYNFMTEVINTSPVNSIDPGTDSGNVISGKVMTIIFNKSLNTGVFGTVAFVTPALVFENTVNCSIEFSTTFMADDTVKIVPDAMLDYNQNYSGLTISGFQDSTGIPLDEYVDAAYNFTTGGWYGNKAIDTKDNVGQYTTMAADGDNIYICYNDVTATDVNFAKSTDGGETWSVFTLTLASGYSNSMAVDGNIIYHVTSKTFMDEGKLFFSKSTTSGNSWRVDSIIDKDGCDVGAGVSLCTDAGNIYISYFDRTNMDYKMAVSKDQGNTWDISIVDDLTGYLTRAPSIAVQGNKIVISYYDDANNMLKTACSSDLGQNWSISEIDTYGTQFSLGLNGNNIYIAYWDGWNIHLKFACSTDFGSNWNLVTLDSNDNVGDFPSLQIDGNIIYISYHDRANDDLKLAKSTDAGLNWNFTIVDGYGWVGKYDSLAVSGNNVYISYYEEQNNYDLKFAKSIDGGETW